MPKLHPVPRLPQRRKQRHCPLKVRATGEGSLGAAPLRAPSCPCTRCAPRRGCAIAYIQTLCGWCGCWRAPTWQGQAPRWPSGTRATAVQVRDHDHRSPFEDHIKSRQRSGHGLSASCVTFMHTALCTAPSWGSPPGAPYLLPPPACVVPQMLPRGYSCASWCSAPLPHPTSALPLCPGRHGGAHCLPTSCELALAPLAPPHTRRFLGESFN